MSQNRISISSVLASVAAVVTLALPGIAFAAYEHPANNEQGVIVHPEHFASQKTRAQVKAETEAAMKQGRLSYGESNYPRGNPETGSGKTREQVINEMLSESSSERNSRLQLIAR